MSKLSNMGDRGLASHSIIYLGSQMIERGRSHDFDPDSGQLNLFLRGAGQVFMIMAKSRTLLERSRVICRHA